MIDRRPALIARCTDAHDVVGRGRLRPRAGLPLSVYGGGHNITGNAVCDDGVDVDLRPMKGRDRPRARARAAPRPGSPGASSTRATQEHGLAVTGGRMSTTGIGGLVLGGGSGWIERKFGCTVDNLLAVEVVTADGASSTASETEHRTCSGPLRGAGANFGVVTALQFRLHPIGPTVLGGS